MTIHSDTNSSSPSTSWAWKRVKIGRPPEADTTARPKGVPLPALRLRDRRKPLTIVVTYRGGSECWWQLRARGVTIRRPGHLSLHDVLRLFDGEDRLPPA